MFTKVALGPKEICGFLVGGDCGHYYNPWKQNWTVTFPNTVKPPPPDRSGVPKVSNASSV